MNIKSAEIVRDEGPEIELSSMGVIKWVFKGLSLLMLVGNLNIFTGGYDFSSIFLILLFSLITWQVVDFTRIIKFDVPAGHLTVVTSHWWSVFIPFGPKTIKQETIIPLQDIEPTVVNRSSVEKYAVGDVRKEIMIVEEYREKYDIQLRDESGKEYTLWSTSDRNTYIDIIERINDVIRE